MGRQSIWEIIGWGVLRALGGSSFFLIGLPSYFFVAVPIFLCIFCFYVLGGLCTDEALWSLSTFLFCWFTILGFIRVQGIAACFSGVFSFAVSVLTEAGIGTSSMEGGIGHDALASNTLVEAGIVFGHGVSSSVGGAVDVAATAVLGCCTIGGLL